MASKPGKGKKKTGDEPSVEEYYKNQNFVMPKEKTLETIFEEPKTSKGGSQQLTSAKKLKRFLQFDEFPSSQKLRKRRKRAKTLAKEFFDLTERPAVDIRYLEKEPSSAIPLTLINKKIRKGDSFPSKGVKTNKDKKAANMDSKLKSGKLTKTENDKNITSSCDNDNELECHDPLCEMNTDALLKSTWL